MAIFSRNIIQQAEDAALEGRVLTRWQYDVPTGMTVISRVQDVEPILEANKQMQTADDGYSPSRELRRVASIPCVVAEQWMKERGINILNPDHMPAIRRLLNDPENLFLRTAPGRL